MALGKNPNTSPWVEVGNGSRLYALLASGNPVDARLDGVETQLKFGKYGCIMKAGKDGIWHSLTGFDADKWEFREVANG